MYGERKGPDLRLISSRSPRVLARHPDTREALPLPLAEFLFRVEKSLDVQLQPEWVPLLVAMADALFITAEGVLWRARAGRGLDPPLPVPAQVEPESLVSAVDAGVVEALKVEEIYRAGLWDSLERPRTWELNGWWERLYGAVPMPPAPEDEDPSEEAEHLRLGVQTHPFGLQSPDNQVRALLEEGILRQDETMYRLRVSVHEQARALTALREGWRIDLAGGLGLPRAQDGADAATLKEMAARLVKMDRRRRRFPAEALVQLVRLGLAQQAGDGYVA